ncbi:glycosyltransferase family 9 protein [Enterobacter bugandensis]
MIQWLRKANRAKNYYLKRAKLQLKLKLLSAIAARGSILRKRNNYDFNHVVIPFIGKGIGDAIVIGGMIDTLMKNNFRVSVIADKRTHFLFKEWYHLDGLYLYDPLNKKPLVDALKNVNPFVFVDSHEITHSSLVTFNLIRLIKPYKTIGFDSRYKIYDDIITVKKPMAHISSRYIDLLEFLGVQATDYDYSVTIPFQDAQEAKSFINNITNKKIIAFIPYGSVSERFFSTLQIEAIINHISKYKDLFHVIILGEQNKIKSIPDSEHVTKNTLISFFSAAQIVKDSALVISPDTSFVHVSRAFNKKLICVYPFKILDSSADNADAWGPNYKLAIQARLKERRIIDADIRPIITLIDEQLRMVTV